MTTLASSGAWTDLHRDLARLRDHLRRSSFAQALTEAEVLLVHSPGQRELMLIVAEAQRGLQRLPDALATLEMLARQQPEFSRLHEERGLCLAVLKDASGAIRSLGRAVSLNPALLLSWEVLEGLHRIRGEPELASRAAAQSAILRALPPELVAATSLVFDGELGLAEEVAQRFVRHRGGHPEALRLLARVATAREAFDEAERLQARALELAPGHQGLRYDYAYLLFTRGKLVLAREEVDRLLEAAPGNPDYRALAASIAVGLGDHGTAIGIYRALLAERPASAELHLWLGHALRTVGRREEAIGSYHAAVAARPGFGDAYWSLANLKVYRFTDAELAAMRAAEAAADETPSNRRDLCFALGKGLEDAGRFEEAWRYYLRGNAGQRAQNEYRVEAAEAYAERQIEVCTPAFFAGRAGWGDPSDEPIFIVGLPRSGSTLIEQILASHSRVEGTQELPYIEAIASGMQMATKGGAAVGYPAALGELTAEAALRLGARYLAHAGAHRTGGPRFIDKMPNNFEHIGLIQVILPNARIIDVRREPMACCVSNLKQLFAQGQDFTYGVEDIARYYRSYLKLMAHWDEALPGRVLHVQYEEVIDDLEGAVRRILDYCGLAFEAVCLDFHATQRSIRTPSSEQVRQPIFRDGLDQWKAFEPWLGELRAALGDAVEGGEG
ncbi:MAG TPA: sulfotransferase [Caulobacteraceae bacterium]|jgi:tetratricopeptide (TPR) repeat protein|nr:sulfotransferase [Caulobacteraceae bacterium]